MRGRGRIAAESRLWGYLFLLGLLALWEVLARAEMVNTLLFPRVSLILRYLGELLAGGDILVQVAISLARSLSAYVIAALFAISLGVIMGYYRIVYEVVEPFMEMLRPMPIVALIPVIILFLGLGWQMKVFIIFLACVWPILLNTIDGVRGIDAVLLHTARTFGASPTQLLRYVILPAALPVIVTGLRISVATSLILMVISEMIGGMNGIGFFILNAQRKMRVLDMFAGIIILGVIGYLFNLLFRLASNRLIHWHHGMTRLTRR